MATATKEIERRVVRVEVGSVVELDSGRTEKLLVCDDWDRAAFRYPNPIREWAEVHAIACNVTITGRTIQYRNGSYYVRVAMEWPNEDEVSGRSSGWLLVNPWTLDRVED